MWCVKFCGYSTWEKDCSEDETFWQGASSWCRKFHHMQNMSGKLEDKQIEIEGNWRKTLKNYLPVTQECIKIKFIFTLFSFTSIIENIVFQYIRNFFSSTPQLWNFHTISTVYEYTYWVFSVMINANLDITKIIFIQIQ